MCVIFSNVSFHMSSQIAWLNRCKVTRVADMQNFSIKWFSNVFSNRLLEQMQSHKSCICAKFLHYYFQTSSQIALFNRCKVTLVACLRLSQMLVFTCLLKSPAWTDPKSQQLQICDFPKCHLKSPTSAPTDAKS